jgi:hypothetical protein
MCDNCTSRNDYCILRPRVTCQVCNKRKVQCSFLDGRRKRTNEEVVSEDEKPAPKKAKVTGSRPSGPNPAVVISGPSGSTDMQPGNEMVELLRELVGEVRELAKVTRSLAGVGYPMCRQNTKLIQLRERQAYLAEQARGESSCSCSETEKEE